MKLSDDQLNAYRKAKELKHNYNRILGENQFMVYMLRNYGLSIDQIANILNNQPKTVYNLYYQAEEILGQVKEFYKTFNYDDSSTEKLLDIAIKREDDDIRRLSKWYFEKGFKFDYLPESERNSELAIKLLKKAETDLKSAKHLYRKGIYDDTIFHIQQSVEKLGKSILLLTGFCAEKDLKKIIRHELADYILTRLKDQFASFESYEEDSFYEQVAFKINEIIDNYKSKRRSKTPILDYSELKEFLSGFNQILATFEKGIAFLENEKETIYRDLMPFFNRIFDIVIDEYEQFSGHELEPADRKIFKNEYEGYLANYELIQELINTIYVFILLIYITVLSMHLEGHVTTSRYPEADFSYTKEHELVRLSPTMLRTMTKVIDVFYHLISLNEELE